jgi:hypothetical protein
MLPGLFFTFWRGAQILTLIPTVGMLSWFVHGFVQNNELMPNLVLVLFIVSVLALVWALATVIFYTFTKHNALFVAFIELCFVGAFIAGVYELRSIAHSNCAHFDTTDDVVYLSLGPFGAISSNVRFPYPSFAKNCSMLKACFAFGIMECIFFFFTFVCYELIYFHQVQEILTLRLVDCALDPSEAP